MIGLVLAAAGVGRRFGAGIPKQFRPLEGRPVYLRSLEPFRSVCQHAVIAVPAEWVQAVQRELRADGRQAVRVVAGGPERQDSVRLGLDALPGPVSIVLVHDAARPYCSKELILQVVEGARLHRACIPATPPPDTVKRIEGGVVVETLDRNLLRLAQTPQGFDRTLLQQAFDEAERTGYRGTDESALVERLGVPVCCVEGDPRNLKITWKEDL